MIQKQQKEKHILWRVLDWIFPSFTELQLIVIFSIIAALIATNQDTRNAFIHPKGQDLLIVLLAPPMLLLFTMVVFIKEKVDNGTKEFLITVYYAFVAILAGIALKNHVSSPDEILTLIARANLLFIGFLFVTATIRFIFAWFLNDGVSSNMDKFIGRNFKDDQFRYSVHIVVALLTVGAVVGLSQIYESTATVTILAFGYMSVFISALNSIFKPQLIQAKRNN